MTRQPTLPYRSYGVIRWLKFSLVALAAALLAACETITPQSIFTLKQEVVPSPEKPQVLAPKGDVGATLSRARAPYLISVGDVLDVRYPYRSDFDETVTVLPDGTISLALLNSIDAAGKTVDALRQELVAHYREYSRTYIDFVDREYRISPGDVLEIRFPYRAELSDEVIVRPDGRISLALVRSIVAAGKSPEALEKELIERYSEFFDDPELVVIVRELVTARFYAAGEGVLLPIQDLDELYIVVRTTPSALVYVSGEVARPGQQPYLRQTTLLQAIIAAGGHEESADMRNVVVLRKSSGAEPALIVRDLKADLTGKGRNDIFLEPYDVIVVPKTAVASVRKFLDEYVYNLVPALRNTSVGFSFLYDLKRASGATTFE